MGIMLIVNRNAFYEEKEYGSAYSGQSEKEISLNGTQEICQEFVAKEKEITKVMLDFKAWEQKNGSGTIVVEIQNKDGMVLATAQKEVRKLKQSKTSVTTTFAIPVELVKDEVYNLVIRSQNVKSEKGVYLYEIGKNGDLFNALTVNGAEAEGHIKLKFGMMHMAYNSMILMFMVLGAAAILVGLPLDKFCINLPGKEKKELDVNKLLARILFILSVPMAFFIVQRYSGYGIGKFIRLSFKF